MSRIFQITGLPRSGTAFLSSLFNLHPSCIAYHELIATEEDWRAPLESSDWENVADVGTYQYFPGAVIPRARKVFVDRPAKDSCAAWNATSGYAIQTFDIISSLAQEWVEREKPLVVNYASLWSVQSLKEIWDYCFEPTGPGIDVFPEAKAKLLLRMNIQRIDPATTFDPAGPSSRVRQLF